MDDCVITVEYEKLFSTGGTCRVLARRQRIEPDGIDQVLARAPADTSMRRAAVFELRSLVYGYVQGN